ncbi:MAG TPA: bifunctional phosphoglucose/phosphomannose isomerase [Candidatus Nanoarchaeia archaeon]|nr:bifunctional phosphoglucose/phosphomannose isomerase [Candidatus Nanoarchaeia archaeon]
MNLDSQNMKGVLDAFPEQCAQAIELGRGFKISAPISAIVFCGIGGSAIPAEVFQACFDLKIPIIAHPDYGLPKCIGPDALVFAVSYSGNTEETLDACREAMKRKCQVIGLSSGGKLREICTMARLPFIEVPAGLQPRDAIGYMTIPLMNVCIDNGLIPRTMRTEIHELPETLKQNFQTNAKELADKLTGKVPIIYASRRMRVVARTWKKKFNENAKIFAFANEFPELNHNELVGYTTPQANFFTIIIEDETDHPRIRKRMEITKKLIQQKGIPVFSMKLTGSSQLTKVFSAILLGSWVSYEVAMTSGVDPSPVEIVEHLKSAMRH